MDSRDLRKWDLLYVYDNVSKLLQEVALADALALCPLLKVPLCAGNLPD